MKISKRPLLKRSPAKPAPRRRLRASTKYEPDEHDVEEPNVRLSRVFVVVLLLHVVAVGGIFAFSALKDHQQVGAVLAGKGRLGAAKDSFQANGVANSQNELTPAVNAIHRVKPGETLASIAGAKGISAHDLELANNLKPNVTLTPGKELIIPEKAAFRPVPLDVQKLVENSRAAATSKNVSAPAGDKGTDEFPRIYVVQRGDTPALIAKRLKVSAAELLKANNIEDPKRLQVGQKLTVP
ncbi:MAG: LysM peptidoglycan-binding domain-containing protein [Verrucomicrobia bacterium]|nr:LysM peptidoglycan-binding domain-containing protein [Verrucomicrobiota bacterium]